MILAPMPPGAIGAWTLATVRVGVFIAAVRRFISWSSCAVASVASVSGARSSRS